MNLALDAMGGDYAPRAAVEGAVFFARAAPQHRVILVGDEAQVGPLLGRMRSGPNVELCHAPEVVEMEEGAAQAIRRKRQSSLRVCFDLIREGTAQAMVSAGHSGAVLAGALLVLGRLGPVERPAIAALFPGRSLNSRWLLLDAGANVQCKPRHLAQFAVMGEAFVRSRLGVERPKIALLANGEEDSKGTDLTRETLRLLRHSKMHVVGHLDGKDLFSGRADVVVTDGFTGNIALKTAESTSSAMTSLLREAVLHGGVLARAGAALLKPVLGRLRNAVDYAEIGGAPLLGVNGVGVVAHGRSSPKALMNALFAAADTVERGLREELEFRLNAAKVWLDEAPQPVKHGTNEDVSVG
ncbi:MAG: phosphate acyltransferase PlsX [Myxococcaceae bacterium]